MREQLNSVQLPSRVVILGIGLWYAFGSYCVNLPYSAILKWLLLN